MKLPKVIKIKQYFEDQKIHNIEEKVVEEFRLHEEELNQKIRPGMKIAITAGSRGIANMPLIIRTIVQELKRRGAEPFIVTAMGSHGGATAEGQIDVLHSLGITEEYCKAPILSTMEVEKVGETKDGIPVYMDKIAYKSDGVILVNRIKKHTDFTAKVESGLMKISTIGLGNHKMASTIHSHGVYGLQTYISEAADIVFQSGKILAGIGLVENAFENTSIIELIQVNQIQKRERELLEISKDLMPKLPISSLDILFVDEIGKNFSGTGMDTNIIGRRRIKGEADPVSPEINYIIAGDLTEASHGNAIGIGLADLTTEKLYKKIDIRKMNENVITTTFLQRGHIPLVLPNENEAIKLAMKSIFGRNEDNIRFMRIANTLHLEEMYISEALLPEVTKMDNIEIIGELEEMKFDNNKNLLKF